MSCSFDYEGVIQGHGAFKDLCDRLYTLAKTQLGKFLLLYYPSAPCRQPERLCLPLEGFGIHMTKLADSAGIKEVKMRQTTRFIEICGVYSVGRRGLLRKVRPSRKTCKRREKPVNCP